MFTSLFPPLCSIEMEDGDDATTSDENSTPTDGGISGSSEQWSEEPLKQSTYLFIWAIASIASFAIFVIYF